MKGSHTVRGGLTGQTVSADATLAAAEPDRSEGLLCDDGVRRAFIHSRQRIPQSGEGSFACLRSSSRRGVLSPDSLQDRPSLLDWTAMALSVAGYPKRLNLSEPNRADRAIEAMGDGAN